MSTEIKVPVLPESVADATVATWHKQPGESIQRDENLVDLETDKVVLEVPSPVDGVFEKIVRNSGETVTSGELLGVITEGFVESPGEPAAATKQTSEPTDKTASIADEHDGNIIDGVDPGVASIRARKNQRVVQQRPIALGNILKGLNKGSQCLHAHHV